MLNKGCGASVGFKAFDVECVFGVRVFCKKTKQHQGITLLLIPASIADCRS